MFLADLLVVFAVTAVVVFVFGRAHLPSVVGLLVSGVVVGPYGLSLVADIESVQVLAEIGIVVLLFTVGLEISLSRLVVMLPLMLRIGLPQAVFAGLLVAMSSTAIALKLLGDRGETAAPHGRIAVAALTMAVTPLVSAALPAWLEHLGHRP